MSEEETQWYNIISMLKLEEVTQKKPCFAKKDYKEFAKKGTREL